MPPQPRQRTKLGNNRPGSPGAEQQEHSSEPGASRGRAGAGREGAPDPGAQNPEGSNREPEPGRAEPEIQVPGRGRAGAGSGDAGAGSGDAGAGREVTWTPAAKMVRAALTAWSAARRKTEQRSREARDAAEQVPAAELAVIVERVAQASGEPLDEVRLAAGLDAGQ